MYYRSCSSEKISRLAWIYIFFFFSFFLWLTVRASMFDSFNSYHFIIIMVGSRKHENLCYYKENEQIKWMLCHKNANQKLFFPLCILSVYEIFVTFNKLLACSIIFILFPIRIDAQFTNSHIHILFEFWKTLFIKLLLVFLRTITLTYWKCSHNSLQAWTQETVKLS